MMHEAPQTGAERSIGDLLGDLTREITTLVRQELVLARTEMGQKVSGLGKDVGMLVAGGAVAYAGLLALVAAVIILLAKLGLDWWLSALIVGIVVAGVGGMLASKGLAALKQVDLVPRQSLEALKEDANEPTPVRRRAA
jgi:hypothetical protein